LKRFKGQGQSLSIFKPYVAYFRPLGARGVKTRFFALAIHVAIVITEWIPSLLTHPHHTLKRLSHIGHHVITPQPLHTRENPNDMRGNLSR